MRDRSENLLHKNRLKRIKQNLFQFNVLAQSQVVRDADDCVNPLIEMQPNRPEIEPYSDTATLGQNGKTRFSLR